MLAIRLQRTGRKGHAQYRVVVQESRLTPTSGRIVYRLGNFDPHTKVLTIDSEKADFYLKNGAQPSDRVARLFKKEGVKLPAWVQLSEPLKRKIRNPEKLRKNRPDEPAEPETPAATDEPPAEDVEQSTDAEGAKAEPESAEATDKPAAEGAPKEDKKS